MSTEDRRNPTPEDRDIEREIRSQRRFSLAEAIGRESGEHLKGASPVTRKRQAEFEIELYLEQYLRDPEGALRVVLLRRASASESLLAPGFYDPLAVLARVAGRILDSETRLQRFVRAVDAEWGRIYSERPYFEREGAPPHREDPYTVRSVREALRHLLGALELQEHDS